MMIKIRGNNPILTLKTSHFPSYLININSEFLSNLHNRVLFYKMIKIRGNNPILTLKPNISFICHQHQLQFLSNLHNRVLFCMMIKIRGNNPILTLKTHIFPSYLININSNFFQTFTTVFYFTR